MAGKRHLRSRHLGWMFAALMTMMTLLPMSALADTNLEIGGQAVIAYANGDNVRLREKATSDSAALLWVAEGSTVDVLEGPVTASNGSLWYKVTTKGVVGFIIQDYLALPGAAVSEPVATPVETETPAPDTTTPVVDTTIALAGPVTGTAVVAGTNGDGVRCRATPAGSIITVIAEGLTVELSGEASGSWQPVNCAGKLGYVSTQFLSYGGQAVTPEPEPSTDESADAAEASTTEVTGTMWVNGTNGDGVRCRSGADYDRSVITVLPEGSEVSLRGDVTSTGWQRIWCANRAGFVRGEFLSASAPSANTTSQIDLSTSAVTGTATVTGTNGDGVRCRASAGTTGAVITVLPEGTAVQLRGAATNGWQPVTCASKSGFVSSTYLTLGGGTDTPVDTGTPTAPAEKIVTGYAYVTGSGSGVNCRAGAGFDKRILKIVAEGAKVELRGGVTSTGWQLVWCGSTKGHIYASFLTTDGEAETPVDNDGSSGGDPNTKFATDSKVQVSGTNGTGVRMRTAASFTGSIIMTVGEGKIATVRAGSTGEWVAVTYSGQSGFINQTYLVAATASTPDPVTDPGSSTGLTVGAHAKTLSALNLRYESSYSAGVAAVAPAGTVVEISGAVKNGFYPVKWDGLSGYMAGQYLAWTDQELSLRGGSADPGTGNGGGGSTGGSATGNSIVNFAMQYVGYPYVWATAGPASFDCSGFTYWVIKNIVGVDIGRGTYSQTSAGVAVSQANLQPGDVVFFQNTYKAGLSHVGIYIGGGQMVHAENPTTGVLVSNINSTYYSSRWYGAVRIG